MIIRPDSKIPVVVNPPTAGSTRVIVSHCRETYFQRHAAVASTSDATAALAATSVIHSRTRGAHDRPSANTSSDIGRMQGLGASRPAHYVINCVSDTGTDDSKPVPDSEGYAGKATAFSAAAAVTTVAAPSDAQIQPPEQPHRCHYSHARGIPIDRPRQFLIHKSAVGSSCHA